MKFLLDTSVYSQPIKRNPRAAVVAHWKAHAESDYAISALCELEVLFGVKRAKSERLTATYRAVLRGRFPILSFDAACAELYAEIQASCVEHGQTRPAFNLMIAATAIVHGLELATCNAADFQGIPGLTVCDWSLPIGAELGA